MQWTKQYLEEFYAATDRHDTPGTTPEAHAAVWTPPPTQRYKVNVDGAVFRSQRTAGVGVLIRDCHGQVIAALSKKICAPLGPLEVEAKAFEAGIQFAKDVGIQDFIVEGDSMILYNALCGNTSPPYLGGSCGFGYDSDVWGPLLR